MHSDVHAVQVGLVQYKLWCLDRTLLVRIRALDGCLWCISRYLFAELSIILTNGCGASVYHYSDSNHERVQTKNTSKKNSQQVSLLVYQQVYWETPESGCTKTRLETSMKGFRRESGNHPRPHDTRSSRHREAAGKQTCT